MATSCAEDIDLLCKDAQVGAGLVRGAVGRPTGLWESSLRPDIQPGGRECMGRWHPLQGLCITGIQLWV